MTDPKAKAQEIVEKHRDIVLEISPLCLYDKKVAISYAISEVEGKIALLNEMLESDLNNDFDILMKRGEYLAILRELKNMNR